MTISTKLPGSVQRDPETRGLRVAVFSRENPGCGPRRRCTSAGASQAARALPGWIMCRRRMELPAGVWTARADSSGQPMDRRAGARRLHRFSCRVPAIAEEPEPVQLTWLGWCAKLLLNLFKPNLLVSVARPQWPGPKVLHLTELAAASARFWSWSLRAHEAEGTRRQIHSIPRGAAMDQQRQQKEADIDGAKTAGGAEPGGASAWHLKTQESG